MCLSMDTFSRVSIILLFGFLTIATIHLISCYGDGHVVCKESEREALLRFKQDLTDPSSRLSSWDAKDGDCCKWLGVVCNDSTGHVLSLFHQKPYEDGFNSYFESYYDYELTYNKSKLGGKINPSLLNLTHLLHLDLSGNDFGGIQIPSFFGSLVSLQSLFLNYSGFVGTIPPQLGNLSTLHFLSIADNALKVENLGWLSGLTSLKHLDMSGVNFSKAANWLEEINMLPSLAEVHLVSCSIEIINHDQYPVNFSSLSVLNLSFNNFNRPVPAWILGLINLVSLDLSFCNLLGQLPDGFRNFTSLKVLDLSGNVLKVENLGWLSGLTSLEHLDMSGANLSKAANWLEEINMLPSLVDVHLASCSIEIIDHEQYPVNSSSISVLDLSFNNFSRPVPAWIFGLTNLVSLDLTSCNFLGPLSDGFRNFTSLEVLYLSDNPFNSTLPDWVGRFSHLEILHLSYNQLHGVIPSALGNLSSAIALDLRGNHLVGKIPKSIGKLCDLRSIDFSKNKLRGNVSEMFESLSGCNLDSLEEIAMEENQFTGEFTDQLGQFRNLRNLFLPGNSISGPIPKALGRLSSLMNLWLSNNKLSGNLPESVGQLYKLEELVIGNNLLEGIVFDKHFANLTALRYLDASGNSLTLRVGPNWIPPFQLQSIRLASWHLGPHFPMWLQSQKQIQVLDISSTRILDTIPPWIWNFSSSIDYFNISHNQIRGNVPDMPSVGYEPSAIILHSNNFNGLLPRLSSTRLLDLSNNFFSGSISHFICMNKSHKLGILYLGGNHLSGEIPDCWRNWQALEFISMDNNNLTGNIPQSFRFLTVLESLHLRNNKLSGQFPLFLQNCISLQTIDLSENEFYGTIPTWIGESLPHLQILNLHSNKFFGEIVPNLCRLNFLQILDMADNNLSGLIPRCIKNFTGMTKEPDFTLEGYYGNFTGRYSETAILVTKGNKYQYDTLISLVTTIDLSGNNLFGDIPLELTGLFGLRLLNLSRNHLSGMIPLNISDMKLLESLDFSRNQLSGNIPPSMSSLNFLGYLDLSYNNLSGRIPTGTQLQSFDNSSYVGNKLCGAPLTNNCSVDGISPHAKKNEDGEDAKSEVDLFFVFAAFGFVVGFWVVVGPLFLKRSWRIAYFRFLDTKWDEFYVFIMVNCNRF